MKKRDLKIEVQLEIYKKKYRSLAIAFTLVILIIGYGIYINFDYLAFKYFIAQHYIYTDTLDTLFKNELKKDINAKYYSYFDDLVISMVSQNIRKTANDPYTYLYIPEQYQKYKIEEKEEALKSEVKMLKNQVVYLRLTNFSKHTQAFIKNSIEQLNQYPYLIIDLRDNYGGDIFAMKNMANLFLPKGSIISKDTMRLFRWTHRAKKSQVLSYQKIIILQNKNSASAAENFIVALRDNLNNVTLMGETTFGKGIGQFTLPLRRGFAVKATTMRWYTPNGENIHQKGINPDISYINEDIITFALKHLPLTD